MLLTIAFRNAFPTLSHNFIQAMLNFFSFSPMFVTLVVASLGSQYHFLVGSTAIKEVTFSQKRLSVKGTPFLHNCSPFVWLLSTRLTVCKRAWGRICTLMIPHYVCL